MCYGMVYLVGSRVPCVKALTRPAGAMITSSHEVPEDYMDDKVPHSINN